MTQLFIGADPGLHRTAIAAVGGHGHPIAVWIIKHEGSKDREAVMDMIHALAARIQEFPVSGAYPVIAYAVESQELAYTSRSKANPRDVAFLSNVSGALLMMFRVLWISADSYLPAPQAWKGDVPKSIHHARLFGDLGWAFKHSGKKAPKRGEKDTRYGYPTQPPQEILGIENVGQEDWKELADAIALARWVKKQWEKSTKRERSEVVTVVIQADQVCHLVNGQQQQKLLADYSIEDGVPVSRTFKMLDGTPCTAMGVPRLPDGPSPNPARKPAKPRKGRQKKVKPGDITDHPVPQQVIVVPADPSLMRDRAYEPEHQRDIVT